MELTLEDSSTNGRTPVPDERSWLVGVRDEIAEYAGQIEQFSTLDVSVVLSHISSIHARLSNIRMQCMRSGSRTANALRTQQIDPLIDALEFQFKVTSRSMALMELEWQMARGQA